MSYNAKNIEAMNLAQLTELSFGLAKAEDDLRAKHNTKKMREKFANQPPPQLNPQFVELKNRIAEAIQNRQAILKEQENEH